MAATMLENHMVINAPGRPQWEIDADYVEYQQAVYERARSLMNSEDVTNDIVLALLETEDGHEALHQLMTSFNADWIIEFQRLCWRVCLRWGKTHEDMVRTDRPTFDLDELT